MELLTRGALRENAGNYWLPSKEINAIFYYNEKLEKLSYIGEFENCRKENAWQIAKVVCWDNEVVFFSLFDYQLWKYNKKTRSIKTIIYFDKIECVGFIKDIVQYQNKVYVFGNSFENPIICYDLEMDVVYQLDWNCDVQIGNNSMTKAVIIDDKIYFFSRNPYDIYLFTLECRTDKITHQFMKSASFINCFGISEQMLWILAQNEKEQTVLQGYNLVDIELKREIILKECEQIMSSIPLKYSDMILHNGKIFLLPGIAEKIFVYDLKRQEEQVLDYLDGYRYRRRENIDGMFYSNQRVGNDILLFPYCSNGILKLNLDSGAQNLETIYIERELYLEVLKEELVKNKLRHETPNIDLWKYIESVKKINKKIELNQKDIGALIIAETKDSANERGI